MRIALDATPLSVATGGIRRYAEQLAAALPSLGLDVLLATDQLPTSADTHIHLAPEHPLHHKWWSLGLPHLLTRDRLDLFHGTDFAVPWLPLVPSVMTVHDLSPWQQDDAPRVRIRRRTSPQLHLGLADMIITPTEAIRRDVINRFRLSPAQVVATPLAPAPLFQPAPLPLEPYLLFVGTLEVRKNIGLVIAALQELRRTHDIKLVIAGRPLAATVPPDEPGLTYTGTVTELELLRLYQGALALVHPSRYEGFGLPILEAMACGLPVLALRTPATQEVAADAALLLDNDVRAWRDALAALIDSPAQRAHWSAQSLRRARDFSWPRTAAATHHVYEEALRRYRG